MKWDMSHISHMASRVSFDICRAYVTWSHVSFHICRASRLISNMSLLIYRSHGSDHICQAYVTCVSRMCGMCEWVYVMRHDCMSYVRSDDMSHDMYPFANNVTHCNTLQHIAIHCNSQRHTATHCNTLQRTATHCNTLQHIATNCKTLQYTATQCVCL